MENLNVVKIPLTQGQVTLIDYTDYELVSQWKWRAMRKQDGSFYAVRNQGKKLVWLHRVILERKTGQPITSGVFPDHKNGDSLDNTRANLRPATHAQNMRNRKLQKNNTTGLRGVVWSKQCRKWQAQIRVDGKLKYLGLHPTPESAYQSYCNAAKEYFGEFARAA